LVSPGVADPFPASLGAYVHIPFCANQCDYCSFSVFTDKNHLHRQYVDSLLTEIATASSGGARFDTVFIGGGTPSLLSPSLLAEVISALTVSLGTEVTVECNPDDVTALLLHVLQDAGVNRVSLGVQSTVDHVLKNIGRRHDRAAVGRAVALLKSSGMPSWNLDLIYGAANESIDDWRTTLTDALGFGSVHISAYALTVEGGTVLARDPLRAPDEDDQADKYEVAEEVLGAAGFVNYEVSNWAQAGHECQHNWRYWRQGDYLGFGCAAHSHLSGRRWWNVRTPDRYIEKIASGSAAESAGELLSADDRALERLQLLLRTREGVPVEAFAENDRREFVSGGLLTLNGDTATLTVKGRLLANAITHHLRVPV
jgi:putative oxygen-independent coproporphyrinogen III oxidase